MKWLRTIGDVLRRTDEREARPFEPANAEGAELKAMKPVAPASTEHALGTGTPPAAWLVPDDGERLREIYQSFDASQPVQDPATLFGRDEQLARLLNGVLYRQTHGVISGPRGAGKTSLATICAERARAEGVVVLYSSNDPDSSFGSLMRQLLEQIPDTSLPQGGAEAFRRRVAELNAESRPQEVAHLLRQISYSALVIIIDEFDRVPDEAFKAQVASLLKVTSDARLRARFILVGDERTYPDILACHASLARHTSHFSVAPLPDDAIAALLDSCASAAALRFLPEARQLISSVVCGSPYHARLFGLHAALMAHADGSDVIRLQDARCGLNEAFQEWESINPGDASALRSAVRRAGARQATLVRIAKDLALRRLYATSVFEGASTADRDEVLALLGSATVQGPDGWTMKDVTAAQFLLALMATDDEQCVVEDVAHKERVHS